VAKPNSIKSAGRKPEGRVRSVQEQSETRRSCRGLIDKRVKVLTAVLLKTSCGIWRRVAGWPVPDVSSDRNTSIFRVGQSYKMDCWTWRWSQYDPSRRLELFAQ